MNSYASGELPWDTGQPEPLLVEFVTSLGIAPGRTLEIGAGTGTNALGWPSAGLMCSESMSPPSRSKRLAQKMEGRDYAVASRHWTSSPRLCPTVYSTSSSIAVVFMFSTNPGKELASPRTSPATLAPGGSWLSLIGSTEGPPREVGPPRRSACEVTLAIEPALEIVELRSAECPKVMVRRRGSASHAIARSRRNRPRDTTEARGFSQAKSTQAARGTLYVIQKWERGTLAAFRGTSRNFPRPLRLFKRGCDPRS